MKTFFNTYKNHLMPVALILGFVVDSLTLQRIDLFFENVILLSYLLVAGIGIIITNLYELYGIQLFSRFFLRWSPILVQFAFGGLFSGFLVFYSRSGSLQSSWPFLLFLLAIIIGSEYFKSGYSRFSFQMSIFFIALFSYSIFLTPIFIGSIGVWVFVLSGIISLLIFRAFLAILKRILWERVEESWNTILISTIIIFSVINVAYFFNVIPPIPLSMKDAGAYHTITRNPSGDYTATYEGKPWYRLLFSDRLHIYPGERVSFYSAVFAPTRIKTKIFHQWEFFDEKKKEWVKDTKIDFVIIGGREGGYRGYSIRPNISYGKWRVSVETARGQIVGRKDFVILPRKEEEVFLTKEL